MESDQTVTIRFLCNKRISPKTFTHVSRHSSETLHAPSGVSGGGASMFDKDVKTYMTRRHPTGHELTLFDIRILALLDEQPFHSAYSIAEALRIFHSTILSHLLESLGMTIFHSHWIPHELTISLRQIRMETYRELWPILKTHEKTKFQRCVTGDESWFTLEERHSTKPGVSRDDITQKVKRQIASQKCMLTVIWEIYGFYVVDLMIEQHS
jgi:hypothetical protein